MEKIIEIKRYDVLDIVAEAHAQKALEALDGVTSTEASHEKGIAVVFVICQ
ncbi:MAG: hypothetical protein ACLUD0_10460 [Eubacterium ramulus]